MVTRKPPGLRGGWAPTQPADAGLLTRPAEPWPATRPHEGWAATRPAEEWAPTRPADLRTGRGDVATAPAPLAAVPRRAPAAAAPVRAAAPRPAAAAPTVPTRAATTPPSAHGHWQLAGTPGENLVLMPGQMHMGQQVSSVRTLLGSCVAITLWHPQKRIGGMCHFLLPSRTRRQGEPADGRYGDEAVEAMVQMIRHLRTSPEEYVAHLYGGADTMSGVSAAKFNIGERNIEQGWSLIDRYGFQLDGVDVGEDIPRMVALSLTSGTVNMRRGTGSAPDHLRG